MFLNDSVNRSLIGLSTAVFLNLYQAVAHFEGQQIIAAHFNEIIAMSVSLGLA